MITLRPPSSWPPWAQYALAVGAALLALAARWLLDPLLGAAPPFVMVFMVLVVLVLSVRPGPFLAASAVALIGTVVLFVQPRRSLGVDDRSDVWQVVVCVIAAAAAALAAWLSNRAQRHRREVEQDLVRRGEQLRLITDQVPALISYIGADLRYQFANARYLDWLDRRPEEIVGRDMLEVLGEAALERVRPNIEAALAGQRSRFETDVPYRNGSRHVLGQYVPDIRADGSVAGFYVLVSDASEQRRAEAAQARLGAIVEASSDAIISTSPDGVILSWNPGAERLFGHSAEQAIGKPLELIVPPRLVDEERAIRERLRRGESVAAHDTVRLRADGRELDVSAAVSPIRDVSGHLIGVSRLDRDITERKQAERTLRESERRLATLVGNLPGMAYRCDFESSWSVEFISERVRDIVGHDADDFVSDRLTWERVTHAEDLARLRQATEASVRDRRPFEIEYRVVHADGSERWVWDRGEPVVDANGELVALEGFVADITLRKRIEHELASSRARERSYLEHLPVGVWFANERGELVFANAAARRIWGGARLVGPDALGEYEAYWHGTDRRLAAEEWALARAVRAGQTSIGEELDILTFEGNRKTILNSAVPVRDSDGNITGAVVMNLDITEQKWAEAALKDADRRKDEFLATLAHELRNPLAAIRTATELLCGRSKPEQLDRGVAVIKRQVAMMVHLIDDLLDVSRITHGAIELRRDRTALLELINQALDAARPWIEAKRHLVEIEVLADALDVEADAVRLVQVFTNILSHACKYTDAGGRIHVRIARDGDEAVVEIRDTGIGIPRDKLDVIFEMFSRLQAPGRGDGGLGIGLALSRRLVELHGGTMQASSEGPGRGSRFVVRLPALPAAVQHAPRRPTTELRLDPGTRRVLVVDDNTDAADTLSLLLAAQGHVVRTAYDGRSALAELASFRPDVLLLDLGLPDIDGTEVCKALRVEPWGGDVFVIALSGWGQERDKLRTAEAGFDAHLTKPANLEHLQTLLATGKRPLERRRLAN